jgi:hypothetical protein
LHGTTSSCLSDVFELPISILPTSFSKHTSYVFQEGMSTIVGMTYDENPFLNFDQLLTQLYLFRA